MEALTPQWAGLPGTHPAFLSPGPVTLPALANRQPCPAVRYPLTAPASALTPDIETAKVAKNAKRRRGKGKWRSGDADAEGDVIPTGAKRSGRISQPVPTADW